MRRVASVSRRSLPQLVAALLCLLFAAIVSPAAVAYWPTPAPTLPAKGGKFTDPTWGTTVMRVTDASDGAWNGNAYSYWPTFNKDNTYIIISNLWNGGDYVQHFDPVNFALVGSKAPLFATPVPGGGSPGWEDVIWSGVNPTHVLCHSGLKIWDYDVDTHGWVLVKDFTSAGLVAGSADISQFSRSVDDNVFGFSLKDASWNRVGYAAWRRDTDTVLLNVTDSSHDEVQIDKSGRYLVAKVATGGYESIVYDLQAHTSTGLTDGDPDYGPGHSDNGFGTVVGYENWMNRILFRSLTTPHQFTVVVDFANNWSHSEHISFLAEDENWLEVSTYDVGTPPNDSLRSEIFLVRTDGSGEVQHICHHYSKVEGEYWASPRANISRDGNYIAFTSRWGDTGQTDLFLARVPVVSFFADAPRGVAPRAVQFYDNSRAATSWSWDFGDGAGATDENPSHVYAALGAYPVALTTNGGTMTRDRYVVVTFPDVPAAPAEYWSLYQILACANAGIVGGYGDGLYRPDLVVTRDAMAVFISRALAGGDAGVPPGPGTASFGDVPTDHWAYKYVEYAKDQGVVGGYPDGTYQPSLPVDRGQMAVFVARAMAGGDAGVPPGPGTASFSDVPTDFWAFKYVEYIEGQSVTGGYPDGTYRPAVSVTRDQMAVYTQRAFDLPM